MQFEVNSGSQRSLLYFKEPWPWEAATSVFYLNVCSNGEYTYKGFYTAYSPFFCVVLAHAWYKSVRLWLEGWCIDWPNKGSSAQEDRQLIDREARGASFREEGLFVLPIWQRGSRQPLIHAQGWQLKNSAIIMTNEERHHSQKIINNRRLKRNAKVREKRLRKLCLCMDAAKWYIGKDRRRGL